MSNVSDDLLFLAGKQRPTIPACDQEHRTPLATTACVVIMRSRYNNDGLVRVSRCSVFVLNFLVLLEYTGCYLSASQFILIIARERTVSYCIVISLSVSWYVSSVQIYRYTGTTMNRFTPTCMTTAPPPYVIGLHNGMRYAIRSRDQYCTIPVQGIEMTRYLNRYLQPQFERRVTMK